MSLISDMIAVKYTRCIPCGQIFDPDTMTGVYGKPGDQCPTCHGAHGTLLETILEAGVPADKRHVFDVGEIDELLDAGEPQASFIGKTLVWHDGLGYPLVLLRDGALAMRMRLECGRCKQRYTTVYLGSGLHNGAWCYAYDWKGEYLANLRDQEYRCFYCEVATAKKGEVKDGRANVSGNE